MDIKGRGFSINKIGLNIIVITLIILFITAGILPSILSNLNTPVKAEQIDVINISESPNQYDYYSNTWIENNWYEFSIESDKDISSIEVNYTWVTDHKSEEGLFFIMSPTKTIVLIGSGETNGSYIKTLNDFNEKTIGGTWRIWIEDISYDGGHKATNITLTFVSYGGKNQCPLLCIKYPTNEQTVTDTITITGEAHDPNGDLTINWIMLNIDNSGWFEVDCTSFWSYEWDSTKVEDGEHTISAICSDGNLQSSCMTVFFKVGNENDPPYSVYNIFPIDGAINISKEVYLEWDGGDPNNDDFVTYDIYLGKEQLPPLIDTIVIPAKQKRISYNPGKLDENTKYYCQIFVKDKYGSTNNSSSWNFTTKKTGEWGLVKEFFSANKGDKEELIHNNSHNPIEYKNEYVLNISSIYTMIKSQSNTPYIAQEELVWGQVGQTYRVPDDDGGKREVKFEMCINYSGILTSNRLGIAEEEIQYILRDNNFNIIKKDEIEHFKYRSLLNKDKIINGIKNISIIIDLQESYEYTLYLKTIAKTTNWFFDFNWFEFSTCTKVDFGENNHYIKYDHIEVYLK